MATLVLAFAADPVERSLYPEPEEYRSTSRGSCPRSAAPPSLGGPCGRSPASGPSRTWLPPRVEPDGESIVRLLSATVAPPPARRHSEGARPDDRSPSDVRPLVPAVAGGGPGRAEPGLGGELLRACLEQVDAEGLPAYLETPNPRNVPFYRRPRFEVTGRAQAGRCPPVCFDAQAGALTPSPSEPRQTANVRGPRVGSAHDRSPGDGHRDRSTASPCRDSRRQPDGGVLADRQRLRQRRRCGPAGPAGTSRRSRRCATPAAST